MNWDKPKEDNFLSKMSPVEKASPFHIAGYLTHKENLTPEKQQNSTVAREQNQFTQSLSRGMLKYPTGEFFHFVLLCLAVL